MSQPWMKFYPRDWRGDQALRIVSLAARGLWIEMLCIMHEASPYGHLLIGDQPVEDAVLARVVGSSVEEVQALLVELRAAHVLRCTRSGVVYSKRMTDDHKRSVAGRKAKAEALAQASENKGGKRPPSSPPPSPPSTQKPEARAKVEGTYGPSTLSDAKISFSGPSEVRQAFADHCGEDWCRSYIDPAAWQDVPERAIVPHTTFAGTKIVRDARAVLAKHCLSVIERRASA